MAEQTNRYEAMKLLMMEFELEHCEDDERRRFSIDHSCSAAILCGLLALKRGLDAEICRTAGLLHDLWLHIRMPVSKEEHASHGYEGALLARGLLEGSKAYGEEEMEAICRMIHFHNDKGEVHGPYEELLKDADVLTHVLNDNEYDRGYNTHGRLEHLIEELGL